MNDWLQQSAFFGIALSLVLYGIAWKVKQKWKFAILNPLFISSAVIILILTATGVSFDTYHNGAKYLSFLLTPVTVCLALPLYRQVKILRKHFAAVLAGILGGCAAHLVTVAGCAALFKMEDISMLSILPKSVTTPIALGITGELGGLPGLTMVGVCFAGIFGAVAGPWVLWLFHIKEPAAQGLALGSASHAVGTSKAVELGEVQAAMGSLAIVVTGFLNVIILPLVVRWILKL